MSLALHTPRQITTHVEKAEFVKKTKGSYLLEKQAFRLNAAIIASFKRGEVLDSLIQWYHIEKR